jgi:hypothetical protein
MTKFKYIPPRPIYFYRVTVDTKRNNLLLAELERIAPWASGQYAFSTDKDDECLIQDEDNKDMYWDINEIIYTHNHCIANESSCSEMGSLITIIGTEVIVDDRD